MVFSDDVAVADVYVIDVADLLGDDIVDVDVIVSFDDDVVHVVLLVDVAV